VAFFLLSTPAAHRFLARIIRVPARAGSTDE
jgi:hypothetical protein